MTQPDGANPAGALNPLTPGSFLDWQNLTEQDIYDRSRAPITGPTGAATKAQQDLASTDGNVIPSGTGLWHTFTRGADATFPRIMLTPRADTTGIGSGPGFHTHTIDYDDPPDYQPAGHGANLIELGFIECTKDRIYDAITFGTGDSVTAFGIDAMYAGAYLMDLDTGDLQLKAVTGDITGQVASTNREYTFNVAPNYALKSEIWAVALLQVTHTGQTCKSILAKTLWPMTAPAGFKPDAMYGYAPQASTLPDTIAYADIVFNAGFCPYYALS